MKEIDTPSKIPPTKVAVEYDVYNNYSREKSENENINGRML